MKVSYNLLQRAPLKKRWWPPIWVGLEDNLGWPAIWPVDGLHVDLVRARRKQLAADSLDRLPPISAFRWAWSTAAQYLEL